MRTISSIASTTFKAHTCAAKTNPPGGSYEPAYEDCARRRMSACRPRARPDCVQRQQFQEREQVEHRDNRAVEAVPGRADQGHVDRGADVALGKRRTAFARRTQRRR